jgi:hypothetical protein
MDEVLPEDIGVLRSSLITVRQMLVSVDDWDTLYLFEQTAV